MSLGGKTLERIALKEGVKMSPIKITTFKFVCKLYKIHSNR